MQCILVLITDALAGLISLITMKLIFIHLQTTKNEFLYLLRLPKVIQNSHTAPYFGTSQLAPDFPSFSPRTRTLDAQDEFVQLKAAQILTILLRYG